eukprot:541282-Prymnesium_polylepis.1
MGVDVRWVTKLPRIKGTFGHDEEVTLSSAAEVSSKGGTVKGSFLRWVDKIVVPAFPNIVRWVDKIVVPAFPNIAPDWEYDEEGEVDADGLKPRSKRARC